MVLHILFMVLIISNMHGVKFVQDSTINNQNDLHIQLGALRLRIHYGLPPDLSRMVFMKSAYHGQEFVKKRLEFMNFIRDLTKKMDQHKANGKVRLL